MLTLRKSKDRGAADHGWLKSQHTFSFASYFDSSHMGFGPLRVINEDRVSGGAGFGRHPHRDMEIISYVVSGGLEHRDSMGNGEVIRPGEIQLMSAGTGVTHSEFNASETEPVHFLQIWIEPAEQKTVPRYDQLAFTDEQRRDQWLLLVSPEGEAEGAAQIGQDARLYTALISAGEAVTYEPTRGRKVWLQVVKGALHVEASETLSIQAGDGVAIEDEAVLRLTASADAEVLLFDMA